MRVEDVDVWIRAAEQLRIHGEEKAPGLELIVLDFPVNRLEGAISNGEDAVPDDVPFLLRKNRLHAHRADFRDSLNTIIPARNSGGDVARRRRLEGDVPDLELLKEFAPLPLVVNRDVVGGVEFPLGVVVEVHVNPVGHDSAGLGGELKVHQRLESAAAIGDGIERERRLAKCALVFLTAELEPAIELESEVRVLPENG